MLGAGDGGPDVTSQLRIMTPGAVTLEPFIQPGDAFHVRVHDPDANLADASADTIAVTVTVACTQVIFDL